MIASVATGSVTGIVSIQVPAPGLCCYAQTNIISFDASGNVRWMVPNETPQIATATAKQGKPGTRPSTGVWCIWNISYSLEESGSPPDYGLAITTGTSVNVIMGAAPTVPGQTSQVTPVLQAQDGSFIGTVQVQAPPPCCSGQTNMVAFDAAGNVSLDGPQ